ncbi:MAG: 4Fe-4S dicluster domain-containing protein [candidate division Zixibacteria bacterium]|nr:4Fe-4S dicluster domain-containing protein [candidate division Zixibacteria bacterium]
MSLIAEVFRPLGHVPKFTECHDDISTVVEPDQVIIPLEYPGQVLYKPLVQAGDRVRKNQIIGRSTIGNCVHASVSGTVREIKAIWTARSFNVPAVVIERDDQPPLEVNELFNQYGVSFQRATRVQRQMALGVVSPWTMPGKFHHEESVEDFPEVRQIVIKGANEEPSIFAFELLLRHRVEKVAVGMKMLSAIAPNAAIWLTTPGNMAAWTRERLGGGVNVAGIPDNYKHRIERLVVPRLTGVDVPNLVPYRKMGVAVLSVEYLLAMVDALDGAGPFVEKHVTVAGCRIPRPTTVRVPIGTPIKAVLRKLALDEDNHVRLLVGGPMKGIAQYSHETPLTKSSHGVYLMPEESIPKDINLTCINCGRCTRSCPVNLQVHLINRYVEYGLLAEARGYHPEACTECGLCAYVCPSHRPLVQLIQMCNQFDG